MVKALPGDIINCKHMFVCITSDLLTLRRLYLSAVPILSTAYNHVVVPTHAVLVLQILCISGGFIVPPQSASANNTRAHSSFQHTLILYIILHPTLNDACMYK